MLQLDSSVASHASHIKFLADLLQFCNFISKLFIRLVYEDLRSYSIANSKINLGCSTYSEHAAGDPTPITSIKLTF